MKSVQAITHLPIQGERNAFCIIFNLSVKQETFYLATSIAIFTFCHLETSLWHLAC